MTNSNNTGSGGLADFVALIACMGCFMYAVGVSQATIIALVTIAGGVAFGTLAALAALVVLARILLKILG